MLLQQKNHSYFVIIAMILILLTLFGGLTLGSVKYSVEDALLCFGGQCRDDVMENIIWNIRLPRTLAAIIGGAGLAVAGTLLQALFRNPLASDSILGISSGASLAVALLIMGGINLGFQLSQSLEIVFVASLTGAMLTMLVIMTIIPAVSNTTTLLLVGLMINFVLSSIISVLAIMAQAANLQLFYTWTLGSFSGITWSALNYLYIIIPLAMLASYTIYKSLDASLLGEGYATSIGVRNKSLRNKVVILSSALSAIVTAISGPVGFIGIAGPYLARLTTRSGSHKTIIPISAVFGALITGVADILARIIIPPIDLPISSITAVIGAPLIITILIRKKGEGLSQ